MGYKVQGHWKRRFLDGRRRLRPLWMGVLGARVEREIADLLFEPPKPVVELDNEPRQHDQHEPREKHQTVLPTRLVA